MEIKRIPHFEVMISKKLFGKMPNGKAVFSYELKNKNGMEVHIINYGATITAIKVPSKTGKLIDVVLGFDTLEQYIQSFDLPSPPYFGATVGRFAGRINNGSFNLNDITFQLNQNNNNNALHGGKKGFSQVVWKAEDTEIDEGSSITFSHLSPNNEECFPGNLKVELTYTLTDNNEIILDYKAVSDEDTIINLTHHSYFNLDGQHADIKNQDLFVNANLILDTTYDNIPTGRFVNLKDHKYNFNPFKKCPTFIDNTFVLSENANPAASLFSPTNEIKMEVFTDQPAVHIYVGGDCFNTIKGKERTNYHAMSGICFETQNFPDAPNHIHFPNAILKKGETYMQHTIYKFETNHDEKDI
ncbi:aldose epimerase family protein [Flavobacterium sp.]|uniref:aldose epimerase family protein n=1 Tax=Flavobacterium sp. TaxID=239 RepID=UPI00286C90B0|nr:aldose epimerase family protein [Flavobacterium sp.]